MNTTDNIVILKDKLGIAFIILILAWIFCNYLVKKFLVDYEEMNKVVETTVKTRKAIFLSFIILLITSIVRIRIITWIALIYYIGISIMLFCALFLSLFEIFMPDTDNRFNKELWRLFGVNTINLLHNALMAYILANVVYQLF
jgi:hypothetical protein